MKLKSLLIIPFLLLFISCSRNNLTKPLNQIDFIKAEGEQLYLSRIESIHLVYDRKREEALIKTRAQYFKALQDQKESIPQDQLLIDSFGFMANFIRDMSRVSDSISLQLLKEERLLTNNYYKRFQLFQRSCDHLTNQLMEKNQQSNDLNRIALELDSLRMELNPLP